MHATDMGEVRATYRSWPGPVSWAVMITIVAGGVIANWVAAPDDPWWFRVFVGGLLTVLCGAFAFPGMLEKHRVCEHGLVLGYRRQAKTRYFVPWDSVDPSRVRILRRAQLVSKHRDAPSSSPHYRIGTGPLAYRGVAVNGLDTASGGWTRIPGVLETETTLATGEEWTPDRFAWWVLGTPRAGRLVAAIEEAMVADGHTHAKGMTQRAVADELVLPWNPQANPLPRRKGRYRRR